jgi:hypothetical protein
VQRRKSLLRIPLPAAGGDEGEGGPNLDQFIFVHPSPSQRLSEPAATLTLPHQEGEGVIGEISNIFG